MHKSQVFAHKGSDRSYDIDIKVNGCRPAVMEVSGRQMMAAPSLFWWCFVVACSWTSVDEFKTTVLFLTHMAAGQPGGLMWSMNNIRLIDQCWV